MWIFGQVWFACLVGFAVGVLLDWVVRVRPLSNRVAELEARLASDARSARSDGEYGRSVFDRGPFSAANSSADGFVSDRNRGGLLTPSGLGTDLLDMGESDRPSGEGKSGVEDFPGVARLSEVWEEAEEATRNAPEPWQPIGPAATAAEESWRDTTTETGPPVAPEPWLPTADEQPTQVSSWMTETEQPDQPDAEADDQYLEFLRAGANHAPTDPELDRDEDLVTQGEMAEPGSGEVTSVLPQIEGYEAYESYADEYEQNGLRRNGYGEQETESGFESNGFQFGEYQPEEVEEPAESSSPLPRRRSGESLRFAPFEIPFDAQDAEQSDVQPRPGEMTPIQQGGFQPFEKPSGVADGGTANGGAWSGDGQLVGGFDTGHANGSHSLVGPSGDDAGSSWFDLSEANPQVSGAGSGSGSGEVTSLTQRMLPVSRPDLDHPDLLRESVFGTETDTQYDDEHRVRSLFEPVVQADSLEDSYQAPAFEPPGYEQQPAFEQPQFEQPQFEQQPFQDQQFEDQQQFEQPEFQDQVFQEQRPYEEQQAFEQPQFQDQQVQDQPFQEQNFDDQSFEGQTFEGQNFAGQDFGQSGGFEPPESALEVTGELPITDPATDGPVSGEFYDETQPPRPIRVRTGVDGPVTQTIRPIPADDGSESGPYGGDETAAGDPGPFGAGSALPQPDGSAPTDGFTVKARTSSMVFHTRSSPFFDRLEPQVWFRSQEDAQRAGFTSWERPRSW